MQLRAFVADDLLVEAMGLHAMQEGLIPVTACVQMSYLLEILQRLEHVVSVVTETIPVQG